MGFKDKMNSWRLGAASYFFIQCLILIAIFFFCREGHVAQIDSLFSGGLSHLVFMGTAFYQFIVIVPLITILFLINVKRTASSLLVLSLTWMAIIVVVYYQIMG